LSAKAHLAVDNNSGVILSEHSAYRSFAPASVTKLMTALVARDIYENDELLSIPPKCAEVDSTKLWLPTDLQFRFEDLLYGLLVSSAGDIGCALASDKFEEEIFVNLMNEKAEELGMTNTQFTNEIGLDGYNGSHYSSAWDLYLLSREAVKDPLIRNIIKTKEYTFVDAKGEFEFDIVNTNKLLWEIPNTVGVKTGTTSGAGEVLLYQYREGLKDITIVVLSSDERFLDTRHLLNWILNSYQWN
jgi:D-alanyl-D-alanine carboxypeptidase